MELRAPLSRSGEVKACLVACKYADVTTPGVVDDEAAGKLVLTKTSDGDDVEGASAVLR